MSNIKLHESSQENLTRNIKKTACKITTTLTITTPTIIKIIITMSEIRHLKYLDLIK